MNPKWFLTAWVVGMAIYMGALLALPEEANASQLGPLERALLPAVTLMIALAAAQMHSDDRDAVARTRREQALGKERRYWRRRMRGVRRDNKHLLRHLNGQAGPAERERIPSSLRLYVIRRDQHTCTYCGCEGTHVDPDGEPWHIDHVVPVVRGGPTHAGNLTLACASCNRRKSSDPPHALIRRRRGRGRE